MILLIEAAGKVVLLLALAALVTGLLRRRSAALRHLVWMVALAGALVLPALSGIVPAWSVAVPVVRGEEWEVGSQGNAGELKTATTPGSAAAVIRTTQQAEPPEDGQPQEAGAAALPAPPTPHSPFLIPALWAVGALAILLYFAMGWLRVARLVHTGRAGDAGLERLLEEAGRAIGLRRAVRAVLTAAVSVPVVWGWRRPVLVLPLESEEWSEGERRSCVLHELAHVRRGDGLAQLVVALAGAAWWFLPPVWFAIRRAADERERACDDVVLRSGARPSEYAGDLLRLVRQSGGWLLPAGSLALGRPSRLGRRVRDILDPARSRSAPGAGSSVTVLASAVTLIVGVAALQPVALPGKATPSGAVGIVLAPADTTVLRVAPPAEEHMVGVSDQLCRGSGSSSTSFNQDNDGHRRWTVHYQGDDCSVDLRAEGKIEFNDDFTDIAGISPGGYFRVKVEDHGERRELEIRPEGKGLSRTWKVNGAERPWDREAQEWLATFLVDLDRRTAVGVDIRFPRLYRQGGSAAVLGETAQMPGDFARGQYYNKLLEHQLKPAELERLLDQVREMHTGDFFAAQTLQSVARQNLSDAGVRASYLQAVNGIGGDFQRGQALQALIAAGRLTPEEIGLVLDGAAGIRGDFQRAQVLIQLIQSGKLDAGERTRVARAVAGIGDFQKSQVLMALAGRGAMSPEERDAFRTMVGEMQSDFSRQQVLQAMLQSRTLEPGDIRLVLDAARGIESDFQRGQVLTQLLQNDQLTEGDLLGVVNVSDGMGDFQRGQVLRAVLAHRAADSAVEQAVMKASAGMGDFERGRVRAGIRGEI